MNGNAQPDTLSWYAAYRHFAQGNDHVKSISRNHAMFKSLLEKCLPVLQETGAEVFLPKGSIIRDDCLYVLLEGSICLCNTDPNGDKIVLMYFEPGMLLNFIPCISSGIEMHPITRNRLVVRKTFAMRVRKDSRCLCVSQTAFMEKMSTSFDLHRLLVSALTENLLNVLSLAVNSPALPAAQRVCRLLSQVSRKEAGRPCAGLTYAEIAAHLAIHKMTVAKIFQALKQEGIVQTQGRAWYIF